MNTPARFPLPIWAKLTLALLIGMLVLFIPALAVLRTAADELARQDLTNYVRDAGQYYAEGITDAVAGAQARFDQFLDDETTQNTLIAALLGSARGGTALDLPTEVTAGDLETLFTNGLLNTTSSFENIRLLDENGQVVGRAAVAGPTIFSSDDESGSAIFREAEVAGLQDETQIMVISYDTTPRVEIANAIVWRDGRILGYVVARMSHARVLYAPLLSRPNALYPTDSYLSDNRGNLFTASRAVAQRVSVGEEAAAAAVERGLRGGSGTAFYNQPDGTPMIVYFSAVNLPNLRGTSLALITEIEQGVSLARVGQFFSTRAAIFGAGLFLLTLIGVAALNQVITPPLRKLQRATDAMARGDYEAGLPDVERPDEIGELAASFAGMRAQLRTQIGDLENRLATRERDMNATQDIGRFAATQRDVNVLMNRVVDLIVDRFPNIYHAQIFLLDSDRANAVVRASTGEVGQELLRRGHQLAVGSVSVIGQVTEQGITVHARDTEASQVHRRNPLLPDTRAELAIPLRLGETIIGALDVQSHDRDAFNDDLITTLTTMADQLAIAIQNARLYQQSEQQAAEAATRNRGETLRAWREYLRDERQPRLYATDGIANSAELSDLRRAAMMSGQPVTGPRTTRDTVPIALPIILRGQTIGAVEWELPAANFSEDRIDLARELAARLAVSLDNARLFQESRRAAERERLVNEIVATLTEQSSVDGILKTAVREVGQALGVPQVSIRLRPLEKADGAASAIPAGSAYPMATDTGSYSSVRVNARRNDDTDSLPSVQSPIPSLVQSPAAATPTPSAIPSPASTVQPDMPPMTETAPHAADRIGETPA